MNVYIQNDPYLGKIIYLIINIYMERKYWEERQLNVSLVIRIVDLRENFVFFIFIFQISYTECVLLLLSFKCSFLKIRC